MSSDVVPAYPHLAHAGGRARPETGTRRSAGERARRRREADEAERAFLAALDARSDLSDRRIKAPAARERVAARAGGGRRAQVGGTYDWFWELAPEERTRIRDNWMTTDRSAMSPDEVEDTGVPMSEWLALTRGIDAARAVKAGRTLQAKRYGGRHPLKFIEAGDPAEHGTHTTELRSRHRPDVVHHVDPSGRVQFFTDHEGVVHPIRASYAHTEAPDTHRGRVYSRSRGRWEDVTPYDDDEMF